VVRAEERGVELSCAVEIVDLFVDRMIGLDLNLLMKNGIDIERRSLRVDAWYTSRRHVQTSKG
jgi:hypothetical protein